MKKSKVSVNYIYNVLYQILTFITPVITAPILTRTLGADNIGIYDYTYSIVNWFILFGMLGVSLYGNKEIAKVAATNNKEKISKVFSQIFTTQLCTVFLSFILFLVIFGFTNFEYKDVYLFQSILIFASAFEISWLYVGLENFKRVALRNFVIKIVTVLGIVFLIRKPDDLILYVVLIGITNLIGYLSLFTNIKDIVHYVRPTFKEMIGHIKGSIVLFIPQIATSVYSIFSKTLLGMIYPSIDEVGFYNYAYKLVTMVLYLVTTIGTVMLPHVVSTIASGNEKKANEMTNQTLKIALCLSFPLAIGFAVVAPYFIPWFLTEEFTKTGYMISILAPIIVFISVTNVFGTQYLIPFDKVKQYTISIICGSIINVISNLILIPKLGGYGAAISAVITEFSVLIVQYIFVHNLFNFDGILSKTIKYFISALIMGAFIFLIGNYMGIGLLTNIIQFVAGVIIYLIILFTTKDDILMFLFKKAKEMVLRK